MKARFGPSLASRTFSAALILLTSQAAFARVLPTAPVSRWGAMPSVQKLETRHVFVREFSRDGIRAIVYDSEGIEPPRDVTPGGRPLQTIDGSAAWEEPTGALRLLLHASADASGVFSSQLKFLYSSDGGSSWQLVPFPSQWLAGIRLGNSDVPFVAAADDGDDGGIFAIHVNGGADRLTPAGLSGTLLGSNLAGTVFLALLNVAPPGNSAQQPSRCVTLDLAGNLREIFNTEHFAWTPSLEGWIGPDGSVFLNVDWTWNNAFVLPQTTPIFPSARSVNIWKDGSFREIVTSTEFGWRLLAVPKRDGSGGWVVRQDENGTALLSASNDGAVTGAWNDPAFPHVEAIYASNSGTSLLLHTSIRHEMSNALGLGIWTVGDARPPSYDEIVLNEQTDPSLVHVDVDHAADGADILLDSRTSFSEAGPSGLGWRPVFSRPTLLRTSLRQRLVVPAAGRGPGANGSEWRTDLVLRNEGAAVSSVALRLLGNASTTPAVTDASVDIGPGRILVIDDALMTLFGLERGSGALLLTPGAGTSLRATSRTYTRTSAGTFGMAVDAEDIVTASRPGNLDTFAAAFVGNGFRTNLISTDLSGGGSTLSASPTVNGEAFGPYLVSSPPGAQTQIDDVARFVPSPAGETGSIATTCVSGAPVTGFTVIDDMTNDPVWWGPDLPAGDLTIPAAVHAGGAHGALFRTDLYVYNPGAVERKVYLGAQPWNDTSDQVLKDVTLAPGETRRIPDVLASLFGLSGVATVSTTTAFFDGTISMTSRTFAAMPDGSTNGMSVPPLQRSDAGDPFNAVEILGPVGGPSLRTNLACITAFGVSASVRISIFDESGTKLDTFDQLLPNNGGVQINDLFRVRGLGDGPRAALIRVEGIPPEDPYASMSFFAYATTIDNGTNDSVFYRARVAGH